MASAQKGIVTRTELLNAGLSSRQIEGRVEKGLLIRVHKGVYRVGHAAPSIEATYLAAVKACGEGAYLCGRAAAHHQGLLPSGRRPPPPVVMCPTERRVPGVQTKRARTIHPLDVATHRGIPITTVPRTLLDLAATTTEDELARAFHEASVRHRITPSQVLAVIGRHPNAKGAAKLRRVAVGDVKILLSKLESGFRRRLHDADLPLPGTNVRVDDRYVDCRWEDPPLTVELDSYRFHSSRWAWERDRRRERLARRRGEYRSYTWSDVFEDPRDMLRELTELLGAP